MEGKGNGGAVARSSSWRQPVFLPSTFEAAEAGGSWNLAGVAIATGIWLVAGLILARVTFRWIRKDS